MSHVPLGNRAPLGIYIFGSLFTSSFIYVFQNVPVLFTTASVDTALNKALFPDVLCGAIKMLQLGDKGALKIGDHIKVQELSRFSPF